MAPLHRTASSPHRGSIEVATLAALYLVYEIVRGQGHATVAAARAHTDWIVELERRFHVFGERTVQHAADSVQRPPASADESASRKTAPARRCFVSASARIAAA